MSVRSVVRWLTGRLPVPARTLILRCRNRGRVRIGKGSWIHPGAQLIGRAFITVGSNTCVSQGSWLNVNDRSVGASGISIGSNCFIGRDNFLSSGASIRIADYCLTTLGCKFLSSSHMPSDPRMPMIHNLRVSDSIDVGPNCFFGAGATVLGNVTIGPGCVVGANATVISDLPSFSVAVGNPARVIKRYSFSAQDWIASENCRDQDFLQNPAEDSYLEMLRRSTPKIDIPWIAAGADLGSF